MTLSWISKVAGWVCKYLCGGWLQERQQQAERERRFRALQEELEQNLRVSQRPFPAGGLVILRFHFSAWDNTKGDLESKTYSAIMRTKLRNVYADIHEFNMSADSFDSKQDHRLKTDMEQVAGRIRQEIEEIEVMLNAGT